MKESTSVFHNGNEKTRFLAFSIKRMRIKEFEALPKEDKMKALGWYDEQMEKLKSYKKELGKTLE